MRSGPTPRRPQPRELLGIGRGVGPGQRQQGKQGAPKWCFDEEALLGGIDFQTGLAQLAHEAQPIGSTTRGDDRDAMTWHAGTERGGDLADDQLGLATLTLGFEQPDTPGRRGRATRVGIGLAKAALERNQIGVARERPDRQLRDPRGTSKVGESANNVCEHLERHAAGLIGQAQDHLGALRNQPEQLLLRRAEIVEALRKQRLPGRPGSNVGTQRLDDRDAHAAAIDHLLFVEGSPPSLVLLGQHRIASGANGCRVEQRRPEPLEARTDRFRSLRQDTPQQDLPSAATQHGPAVARQPENALKQLIEVDGVGTDDGRSAFEQLALGLALDVAARHHQRRRSAGREFREVARVELADFAGMGRAEDESKGHGVSSRPGERSLQVLRRERGDALLDELLDGVGALGVRVVDLHEPLPLHRDRVLGENRLDGALGLAGAAVDALFAIDHQHASSLVDAVDGTDVHTGLVLLVDTGLGDDVGHGWFLRVELRVGSIPKRAALVVIAERSECLVDSIIERGSDRRLDRLPWSPPTPPDEREGNHHAHAADHESGWDEPRDEANTGGWRGSQHRRAEVLDQRILDLLLRPTLRTLLLDVRADLFGRRGMREVETRLAGRAHQLCLDLRHRELRLSRQGHARDEHQQQRDDGDTAADHERSALAIASRRPLAETSPGNHATARPCASRTKVSGNALTP